MTPEEQRELAKMLLPHLAWDLTRSRIFNYQPSNTVSGAAVEVFLQQIMSMIRYEIHSGNAFSVAIIRSKPEQLPESKP